MTMTDPNTADSNVTAESGQGSAPIQQAPGLQDIAPKDGGAAFNDPFHDRRQSDEWDASKVPPSRFQKRKGSIYSTPGSRDGHVDRNTQHKFHETHAEKGYGEKK